MKVWWKTNREPIWPRFTYYYIAVFSVIISVYDNDSRKHDFFNVTLCGGAYFSPDYCVQSFSQGAYNPIKLDQYSRVSSRLHGAWEAEHLQCWFMRVSSLTSQHTETTILASCRIRYFSNGDWSKQHFAKNREWKQGIEKDKHIYWKTKCSTSMLHNQVYLKNKTCWCKNLTHMILIFSRSCSSKIWLSCGFYV